MPTWEDDFLEGDEDSPSYSPTTPDPTFGQTIFNVLGNLNEARKVIPKPPNILVDTVDWFYKNHPVGKLDQSVDYAANQVSQFITDKGAPSWVGPTVGLGLAIAAPGGLEGKATTASQISKSLTRARKISSKVKDIPPTNFLPPPTLQPAFATAGVPNTIFSKGVNLYDDANLSKSFFEIKGSDKPFYPELKPHRAYKTTSKLKTLEDYKQAWRDWPDKTKVGRDAFYKKHGQWIDEGNFKFKPDAIRQSPEDKAAGIKRFTSEMNIRSDKGIWTRKQRGDILTYMSGEAPISTTKASYKDPITGHNIIPHHRTSHGELAPWVDIIIEKLNSPDPKIKAEGKQMLEIGKKVFAKAKIKVGDTLKNYEGYFHKAHLGPGSIHDKLTEHRITGPSSRSAFDFTKGENALSKGIKVGDKIIPTKEYIQQLPWKPGGNTGEFGENTFWTSLVDYIQTSNAARQTAREEVLTQFGPQGKNWAGGEL